ncbi:Transcription factor of the Forkhead/HNF3 family [Ceraceosorus bombacis]|uniref:Transcription factor of the Forkhead/HNF3 family n=1 Tax=Ceraceosorus bombacis TaxID=401625 RepID=A0A0N7LB32_9BASI|nr:Transcription factor of the Forkhead/HNF3 family [Ceraceosorus bombacis]
MTSSTEAALAIATPQVQHASSLSSAPHHIRNQGEVSAGSPATHTRNSSAQQRVSPSPSAVSVTDHADTSMYPPDQPIASTSAHTLDHDLLTTIRPDELASEQTSGTTVTPVALDQPSSPDKLNAQLLASLADPNFDAQSSPTTLASVGTSRLQVPNGGIDALATLTGIPASSAAQLASAAAHQQTVASDGDVSGPLDIILSSGIDGSTGGPEQPSMDAADVQLVQPHDQYIKMEEVEGSAGQDFSHDPPAGPIQAYAKLEFPGFSYYLQTLDISIGRRPAHIPAPEFSAAGEAHITSAPKVQGDVDVDLGPLKSISRLHARIYYHVGYFPALHDQAVYGHDSPGQQWDAQPEGITPASIGKQHQGRFVLQVYGRNGAFVDDVWVGKDGVVALQSKRIKIQIAERVFYFVLPPMENRTSAEGSQDEMELSADEGVDGEESGPSDLSGEEEELDSQDMSSELSSLGETSEKGPDDAQRKRRRLIIKRRRKEDEEAMQLDSSLADSAQAVTKLEPEALQASANMVDAEEGQRTSTSPQKHRKPGLIANWMTGVGIAGRKRKRGEQLEEDALRVGTPIGIEALDAERRAKAAEKKAALAAQGREASSSATPSASAYGSSVAPTEAQPVVQANGTSQAATKAGPPIALGATAATTKPEHSAPDKAAAAAAAGTADSAPEASRVQTTLTANVVSSNTIKGEDTQPSSAQISSNAGPAPPAGSKVIASATTSRPVAAVNSAPTSKGTSSGKAALAAVIPENPKVDSEGKPELTNHQLIKLALTSEALLQAGKASLQDVYDYMTGRWDWFRRNARGNGKDWKSSIRHAITSSSEFIKIARQADDPGKGSFYALAALMAPEDVAKLQQAANKPAPSQAVTPAVKPAKLPMLPSSPQQSPRPTTNGITPTSVTPKGGHLGPQSVVRPLQYPRPPQAAARPVSAAGPRPTSVASAGHTSVSAGPGAKPLGLKSATVVSAPSAATVGQSPTASAAEPGSAKANASVVAPSNTATSNSTQQGVADASSSGEQSVSRAAHSSPSRASTARVAIVIGKPPEEAKLPQHTDNAMAGSINALFGGPPIVHHEGKLYLSPQVFGRLSEQEINRIAGLGAQQALQVLQTHLVSHLQEQMGAKAQRAPSAASPPPARPLPPASSAGHTPGATLQSRPAGPARPRPPVAATPPSSRPVAVPSSGRAVPPNGVRPPLSGVRPGSTTPSRPFPGSPPSGVRPGSAAARPQAAVNPAAPRPAPGPTAPGRPPIAARPAAPGARPPATGPRPPATGPRPTSAPRPLMRPPGARPPGTYVPPTIAEAVSALLSFPSHAEYANLMAILKKQQEAGIGAPAPHLTPAQADLLAQVNKLALQRKGSAARPSPPNAARPPTGRPQAIASSSASPTGSTPARPAPSGPPGVRPPAVRPLMSTVPSRPPPTITTRPRPPTGTTPSGPHPVQQSGSAGAAGARPPGTLPGKGLNGGATPPRPPVPRPTQPRPLAQPVVSPARPVAPSVPKTTLLGSANPAPARPVPAGSQPNLSASPKVAAKPAASPAQAQAPSTSTSAALSQPKPSNGSN